MNGADLSPKTSTISKLISLVLMVLIGFWAYLQWNYAKSSWEGLGDAHFYAICADHYSKTGENRWFELYPIALKKGSGIDMSFSSFAHPFFISCFIKLGWTSSEATLLSTLVAFLAMLASMWYWMSRAIGRDVAWLTVATMLCIPLVTQFANTGGAEALSMFFLVNSLGLLLHVSSSIRVWLVLLLVSVLGAFARPHNQIFLLMMVLSVFSFEKGLKSKAFLFWVVAFIGYKLLGLMVVDHPLKFGYLFSFLVGTDAYPQHSLFRVYFSEGFQSSLLIELKDQIMAKTDKAIRLLKSYWPGWLPQICLMFICLFLRPKKAEWLCWLGVLSGILFVASMGHLVPRYWEMLIPITVLFFIMSLGRIWAVIGEKQISFISILALVGVLFACSKIWENHEHRDVNYVNVPVDLMSKLENHTWVACSQPSKLIDLWKKPILLLPETADAIENIHSEVESLNALVLTPNYQKSEYALWVRSNEQQLRLSWNVYDYGDWVLFIRRNLEKN